MDEKACPCTLSIGNQEWRGESRLEFKRDSRAEMLFILRSLYHNNSLAGLLFPFSILNIACTWKPLVQGHVFSAAVLVGASHSLKTRREQRLILKRKNSNMEQRNQHKRVNVEI